ncbi:VWA domain-containing protein [Bacillus sp. RG28]|uniref:VWA domain-containing protein n=1 Tax=Gottfriedia endophytica TaxID=2820819 RepID=A0A940SMD4_9BACI|nr:VWA domain-containing protein [Gottfriedia endophytica]MBP0727248.1 VWA domain-containing protein [Gottfriedia endophytica]
MYKGTLKQILLITDGCSNHGEDPIAMSSLAKEYGITVNVIGILDENSTNESGLKEIEGISQSGGGISQIVYAKQLSQTVQMVTRKAMTQTIQGFVNKELKQILGSGNSIESLHPSKREEVYEVVEEIGETVQLEVIVLVDTSASMRDKLNTVKESLFDLQISLNARSGENAFSLFVFPGKKGDVEKLLDWTPKLEKLNTIFPKLTMGGMTPTGPAIREAIHYFNDKMNIRGNSNGDDEFTEQWAD